LRVLRTLVMFVSISLVLMSLFVPSNAEAADWHGEQIIDTGPFDAEPPQVAIDSQGNALAVWSQDTGDPNYAAYRLHACRFIPGMGWGAPQLIQNSDANVFQYALAMNPSGDGLVIYKEYNRNIIARSYSIGFGWGVDQIIYSTSGSNTVIGEVWVDMNSQGNALAVWWEYGYGMQSIKAMSYAPGEEPGEADLIAESVDDLTQIQVSLNDQGSAIVVWEQGTDMAIYNVYASTLDTINGWNEPHKINEGNDVAAIPKVAMDDEGRALAVWTQRGDGVSMNTYSNNFDPVTGWGTPRSIQSGTSSSSIPDVAMDGDGNAIAVWSQVSLEHAALFANRYSPGTGWGSAEQVNDDTMGYIIDTQVVLDDDGNALAVFKNDSMPQIHSVRYDVGSGWGGVKDIQSSTEFVQNPFDVAMNSVGDAIVVWESDDDIHANHLLSDQNDPGDVSDTWTDGATLFALLTGLGGLIFGILALVVVMRRK